MGIDKINARSFSKSSDLTGHIYKDYKTGSKVNIYGTFTMNSKAFSWKLLLISDRILFTWVFLFLKPDLFYFNENKGNMFYVISLYNKIRHISEAFKSFSIKKANFVNVREKRTKFIFTHYNNYMYYMYHRYMMFRQVHDEVQSIFIFRFGACWQIINANTACMVLWLTDYRKMTCT